MSWPKLCVTNKVIAIKKYLILTSLLGFATAAHADLLSVYLHDFAGDSIVITDNGTGDTDSSVHSISVDSAALLAAFPWMQRSSTFTASTNNSDVDQSNRFVSYSSSVRSTGSNFLVAEVSDKDFIYPLTGFGRELSSSFSVTFTHASSANLAFFQAGVSTTNTQFSNDVVDPSIGLFSSTSNLPNTHGGDVGPQLFGNDFPYAINTKAVMQFSGSNVLMNTSGVAEVQALQPVPEPITMGFLGAAAVAALRKRRK